MNGTCDRCGEASWLMPLHGDKGGPLWCFMCAGARNAEHSRRRKWGRIIIKAMKIYLKEGGQWNDLDKFKLHGSEFDYVILPGYEEDTIGAEVGDITAELLDDTLQLTHPDRHPPERRDLAKRTTQALLALKPFVFPAPKPEPAPVAAPPPPRDTSLKVADETFKKPSQTYPCELCADHAPYFYCDPCKAEWNKRYQLERERENGKQRKQYARRQWRRRALLPPVTCPCGAKIEGKRKDARYCSAACRQRAHRLVTDKTSATAGHLVSRHGQAVSS
jgi:hypothetical protein